MAVGRRMLAAFARRPALLHAGLTGLRPMWRAFADVTRGATTLAGIVRTNTVARRALEALDRREQAEPERRPKAPEPAARER